MSVYVFTLIVMPISCGTYAFICVLASQRPRIQLKLAHVKPWGVAGGVLPPLKGALLSEQLPFGS